jgi:hypothetical protein
LERRKVSEQLVQDMGFHLVVVPFAIMAGGMALLFGVMIAAAWFSK